MSTTATTRIITSDVGGQSLPFQLVTSCPQGVQCLMFSCELLHPAERWPPCPQGKNCPDFRCNLGHGPKWKHASHEPRQCPQGVQCLMFSCQLLHPAERLPPCPQGKSCLDFRCNLGHGPKWKHASHEPRQCLQGALQVQLVASCPQGLQCLMFSCELLHPAERLPPCPRGKNCPNSLCNLGHGPKWKRSISKAPTTAALPGSRVASNVPALPSELGQVPISLTSSVISSQSTAWLALLLAILWRVLLST